jgi:hypothetical protein
MLEAEQLAPESLGYDRPSAKLLSFLRRHYGLANFIPQPNNVRVQLVCAAPSWLSDATEMHQGCC